MHSPNRLRIISGFGWMSGQNELEVLFRPNRKFRVLEVTKMTDHTLTYKSFIFKIYCWFEFNGYLFDVYR